MRVSPPFCSSLRSFVTFLYLSLSSSLSLSLSFPRCPLLSLSRRATNEKPLLSVLKPLPNRAALLSRFDARFSFLSRYMRTSCMQQPAAISQGSVIRLDLTRRVGIRNIGSLALQEFGTSLFLSVTRGQKLTWKLYGCLVGSQIDITCIKLCCQ